MAAKRAVVSRQPSKRKVDEALMAVVVYAGKYTVAHRALAERGIDVSVQTLRNWCLTSHTSRYQELRDMYAAQLEQQLVGDLRDIAVQSVEVSQLGLERARENLEEKKDPDPARTAMYASNTAKSSIDRMLALSGRPTRIVEDRSLNEILRSLAAKGVLELPETILDAEVVDEQAGD